MKLRDLARREGIEPPLDEHHVLLRLRNGQQKVGKRRKQTVEYLERPRALQQPDAVVKDANRREQQ
jgi:hypothetical protein